MNLVMMIGRLATEPELRYIPSGTAVCNFNLAVDRSFKREGSPTADFFRVTVWGKQAENCANYLSKGRLTAVKGRIEINPYEYNGEKRQSVDITADEVQFLDWGDKQSTGGFNNQGNRNFQNPQQYQQNPQPYQQNQGFSQGPQQSQGQMPQGNVFMPEGLDSDGYKALSDDDVPF